MARARSAQERREAAVARRARRSTIEDAGIVMEAAAAFLAVRQRSVEETRRRLKHLGYPPALCDEVVERLIELGYLDDLAFAKAWIESRDRARPRGEVALRRELQSKGLPDETIRTALADRAGSYSASASESADAQAARRLIERRSASLRREEDPQRRRQRAYALLARSGFAPDICREVSAQVVHDPGPEAIERV
jgi:regulatory protein